MAQRKRRGPGPRGPVVVACVAMLAIALVAGAVVTLGQDGFELERGEVPVEGAAPASEAAAAPVAQDASAGQAAEPERVTVHVDGAVACPGVYELAGEAPRVQDAVDAAGGLAAGADTSGVNLAARIADGTKVHIPAEGEAVAAAPDAASAGTLGSQGSAVSGTSFGLVNINSATAEELQTLSGVGEATARAIVEDRERNGPFKTKEDLMRVSGIGEKKFAKLEGSICV